MWKEEQQHKKRWYGDVRFTRMKVVACCGRQGRKKGESVSRLTKKWLGYGTSKIDGSFSTVIRHFNELHIHRQPKRQRSDVTFTLAPGCEQVRNKSKRMDDSHGSQVPINARQNSIGLPQTVSSRQRFTPSRAKYHSPTLLQEHGRSDTQPGILSTSQGKGSVVKKAFKTQRCHLQVGTSTWLKHFTRLTPLPELFDHPDLNDVNKLHEMVPRMFDVKPQMKAEILTDVERHGSAKKAIHSFLQRYDILNFSFVRHPFERLVSAYVDKVLGKAEGETLKRMRGKSFPQFVDHVISKYKELGCEANPFCGMDVHWRPQFARCLYCDIHYDVIGKMETFGDDVKYIVMKQNLEPFIPIETTGIKTHASEVRPGDKAKKYFRQLTSAQILRLFHIYKPDFLLFDYHPEEYLKQGQS